MFELMDNGNESAVIKVIGVGGGGGNAVQHMVETEIDGVDFICANTDAQHLSSLSVPSLLQLGNSVTKGLGAGANPDVGKQAALVIVNLCHAQQGLPSTQKFVLGPFSVGDVVKEGNDAARSVVIDRIAGHIGVQHAAITALNRDILTTRDAPFDDRLRQIQYPWQVFGRMGQFDG